MAYAAALCRALCGCDPINRFCQHVRPGVMRHMADTRQTGQADVWRRFGHADRMLIEAKQLIAVAVHHLKRNAQLPITGRQLAKGCLGIGEVGAIRGNCAFAYRKLTADIVDIASRG